MLIIHGILMQAGGFLVLRSGVVVVTASCASRTRPGGFSCPGLTFGVRGTIFRADHTDSP